MKTLKDTPEKLVENGQVVDYGLFNKPFRNLNIHEADIFGTPAPLRFFNRFRLKEWQHFAIINPEFFAGFVITDAHYLCTSFCYVVERESGNYIEHHREAPPGVARTARELYNDHCRFSFKDYSIRVENRLDVGYHLAKIDVAASVGKPPIKAEIKLVENLDEVQPLVVVLPLKNNRPLYTHKMPCPVSGYIELGNYRVELDPQRDIGLIDVQKTYYPYNTFWRWATFAGYDKKGRMLAINLVQNMVPDDENNNENVLWVDGKLTPWSAARFEFDEKNALAPWKMRTTDGNCDLTFTPQGERSDKINMGLIVSDYHQPYGVFNGTVTDASGERYEVENIFGVTEHHLARF
jgi:Domain of unknown function (DUF2804), C-terminal/Domain of unknown function (DUF2804), N-terminal